MDGVMSQEEINALLNGSADSGEQKPQEEVLTEKEKDTIGEIANISMGTAATTLFSLVNRKVEIGVISVKHMKSRACLSGSDIPSDWMAAIYWS